jgi:hypothetical protein
LSVSGLSTSTWRTGWATTLALAASTSTPSIHRGSGSGQRPQRAGAHDVDPSLMDAGTVPTRDGGEFAALRVGARCGGTSAGVGGKDGGSGEPRSTVVRIGAVATELGREKRTDTPGVDRQVTASSTASVSLADVRTAHSAPPVLSHTFRKLASRLLTVDSTDACGACSRAMQHTRWSQRGAGAVDSAISHADESSVMRSTPQG